MLKTQQFLYKRVTASIKSFRTLEDESALAGVRALLSEMTGRSEDDNGLWGFAFVTLFTKEMKFEWQEEDLEKEREADPEEIRTIQIVWKMVARGESPFDIFEYYAKNVPTYIQEMWIAAVLAAQVIWKPKEEVTPSAEALIKNPN